MTLLVVYFCLAIFVSFVCSLLEAVILSLTLAHIEVMVEQGRKSGQLLKKFKLKIDHPLSAILTVNTIAHTVGAAAVGAQVQVVFGNKWVAAASGILTFCILVFSEIIPKTLGAVFRRELAPFTAYVIRGLIILTYPFVVAFETLARLISAGAPHARITREEVAVTAEISGNEGELQERERHVIRNILALNNIHARDVMTPRLVLFALPKSETVGQAVKQHSPIRYSRIPVYDKDLDDIVGLVRRYEINQAVAQDRLEQKLEELAKPIKAVPDSKSVAEVLDEFIQKREHIFLVVDEYGGTSGIITLEDAVETLLGVEIVDELDSHEDMQAYALERWRKRQMDLDE